MKKFQFKIKGHEYEVDILHFEQNLVELEVNGTHYQVEVQREVKPTKTPTLTRPAVPKPLPEEATIRKPADKLYPVKTPLPGTILKVLVKPGDPVKKGDTLLIMEAMKMENNIFADKEGKVASVHVREGDTVLQNDTLIEVESI
ncbi:MAG: biotin/lipoyl-binding protein [Saprospiraceae bacterium]|nr:biotin/lipoyl-binding protein [Saprospiraceae bacterium]MCB0622944.1 biotin/lipoyl-binding protein [Saprospiraceae bacterium]MCB0675728.1 biotin/lipoyl-binding protein [Saprospiraceae bacterium]MCB0680547.1 biotin/lipoyl-binding protein [Saprospiraceae bacterium]